MPALKLQMATLANRMNESSLIIQFPPAKPVELLPMQEIFYLSGNIEEVFIYDPNTKSERRYTPSSKLLAEPGSVVVAHKTDGDYCLMLYTDECTDRFRLVESPRAATDVTLHEECGLLLDKLSVTAEGSQPTKITKPFPRAALIPMTLSTATPSPDDRFDRFQEALDNLGKSPEEQTQAGSVPTIQGIIVIPPDPNAEIIALNEDLKFLYSIMSLVASLEWILLQDRMGRRLEPTQDTSFYMRTIANGCFRAPLTVLSGILNVDMGSTVHYNNTSPRDKVHTEFLAEMSQGFEFEPEAMKELDKIFTRFVDALGDPNVSVNDNMAYTISTNWVPKKRILGTDVEVRVPSIKLYFIEMNANSFKQARRKGSVEMVNVTFTYTTANCTLNSTNFQQKKSALRELFNSVSSSQIEKFGENATRSVAATKLP